MNAFEILKSDHKELIAVMDRIMNAADTESEELDNAFQQFKALFNEHDKIEDNVIYPALIKFDELKKLVQKSYQAHHVVEVALLELRLTPYASDNWLAKFSVMRDSILKHMDEEENIMFAKATALLHSEELNDITNRVISLKKDIKN